MLKKYFIAIITIALTTLVCLPSVYAATTATSSATATPTKKLDASSVYQQIDTLKEKIASKVAQMHLVEKRGFIGTVQSASSNQITITDINNNPQSIDVDEITNFSSPDKKSFGISDLTKGTIISVLGIYNKDSQRLLARYVNVIGLPTYVSGEVTTIDRINGTFVIQSEGNTSHNIDVESFTKTYSFSQASNITKIGFSKLSTGDRVIILGYPDKKDPTLTVASRITQFVDVPKNPGIQVNTASSSAATSPTTTKK